MFLSFIVPVYNVEKYVAECLDSLLDQDISHEEKEAESMANSTPS